MALITAQQIVDRAAQTLYDETNIQWSTDELLRHLSDAQRAAVLHLPEINPVASVVPLIAGTRQMIPADGFKLIDVVRNMGEDGQTPGRAIRMIDRSALDHTNEEWHVVTESQPVKHFAYDTRDRRGFYVFPGGFAPLLRIEIIYAAAPPELTDLSRTIGLDDVYQPVLLSYMLHRAYAKDLPVQLRAADRSAMYFQQFILTLTGQKPEDERLHPLQQEQLIHQ